MSRPSDRTVESQERAASQTHADPPPLPSSDRTELLDIIRETGVDPGGAPSPEGEVLLAVAEGQPAQELSERELIVREIGRRLSRNESLTEGTDVISRLLELPDVDRLLAVYQAVGWGGRAEALGAAIAAAGGAPGRALLDQLLGDTESRGRFTGAVGLLSIGDERALPVLNELMRLPGGSRMEAFVSARALANLPATNELHARAGEMLLGAIESPESADRAVWALSARNRALGPEATRAVVQYVQRAGFIDRPGQEGEVPISVASHRDTGVSTALDLLRRHGDRRELDEPGILAATLTDPRLLTQSALLSSRSTARLGAQEWVAALPAAARNDVIQEIQCYLEGAGENIPAAHRARMERLLAAYALDIRLPERLSPEVLTSMVENRNEGRRDTRPVAVVIVGREDHNRASSEGVDPSIRALMNEGYRVMYYEADSDRGFVDGMRDATRHRRADALIIFGHGSRDGVELGDSRAQGESAVLGLEDERWLGEQGVSRLLARGGQVVLLSCSTGEGRENGQNMANMLRRVFPHAREGGIVAPAAATGVEGLDIDRRGRITPQFTIPPEGIYRTELDGTGPQRTAIA